MMKKIKKAMNFIKWTFIWIIYWQATQEDRMSYSLAQSAGHEIYVKDVDSFGGYVAENTHRPPQKRTFRTWKEFRQLNKF